MSPQEFWDCFFLTLYKMPMTFLIKTKLNLWITLSSVDSLTIFSILFSSP